MGMGGNGNWIDGNGREWECWKPFPHISTPAYGYYTEQDTGVVTGPADQAAAETVIWPKVVLTSRASTSENMKWTPDTSHSLHKFQTQHNNSITKILQNALKKINAPFLP